MHHFDMKIKYTHIIIKIEDIDFEIARLKGRLKEVLDDCTRNRLKGQYEAYLAVKMQKKVLIPPGKTL